MRLGCFECKRNCAPFEYCSLKEGCWLCVTLIDNCGPSVRLCHHRAAKCGGAFRLNQLAALVSELGSTASYIRTSVTGHKPVGVRGGRSLVDGHAFCDAHEGVWAISCWIKGSV
eukprot:1927898-Rhodomonas_salina.1